MTAGPAQDGAVPAGHGASLLAMANAVTTMLASFAGFIVVTRLLGADRLGLLALVTAALFPLRFAELGLAGAASRFIGAYGGPDPKRLVLAVWQTVVPMAAAALTLLTLACLIVSPALMATTIPATDTAAARELAGLVWLLATIQLLSSVANATLVGLQRFRRVYLTGITISLLQLCGIVPLVLWLGIAGFVVSQIAGHVITLLVGLFTVSRIKAIPGIDRIDFDRTGFVAFAGQFALNSLVAAMLEPAVKLLFGGNASLKAMGHFEIFWRLFVQVRTVLLSPLEPVCMALVRHWQDGTTRVAALYGQIFVHSMLVACALVIIALPIHLVLSTLVPDLDGPAAITAQAIGLAMAFGFVTVPTYYLALATGRIALIALGTVVKLAAVGVSLLASDQAFGWLGALVAMTSAYFLGAVAEFAFARWLTGVHPIPDRAMLRHGSGATISLAASLARRFGIRRVVSLQQPNVDFHDKGSGPPPS